MIISGQIHGNVGVKVEYKGIYHEVGNTTIQNTRLFFLERVVSSLIVV